MTLYYKYVLLLYMYTMQFVYMCTLTQCSKCIICESHIYAFMIGIETRTNSNTHCSISQYTWDCMMMQFYLYVTILIIRNSVTLNLFFCPSCMYTVLYCHAWLHNLYSPVTCTCFTCLRLAHYYTLLYITVHTLYMYYCIYSHTCTHTCIYNHSFLY